MKPLLCRVLCLFLDIFRGKIRITVLNSIVSIILQEVIKYQINEGVTIWLQIKIELWLNGYNGTNQYHLHGFAHRPGNRYKICVSAEV